MADYDVREALCEIGRRVWTRGFVAANDGNFSFRLGENRILATPTRVSKGFMTPGDLVEIDLEGNRLSGIRSTTSEIKLHLNAYRRRPDIRSVVHVHPPHATAFAISETLLPKGVLEESELCLGEVPLVPYRTTGTWEFARGLDPWIETHDVFLLANHGAVTFGVDPFDAYYKMEVLDQTCQILLLARQAGEWTRIPQKGMEDLLAAKARHGLIDPRDGLPVERFQDDEVLPRRADSMPGSFEQKTPEGEYPRASDEPKHSSAPRPKPLVG